MFDLIDDASAAIPTAAALEYITSVFNTAKQLNAETKQQADAKVKWLKEKEVRELNRRHSNKLEQDAPAFYAHGNQIKRRYSDATDSYRKNIKRLEEVEGIELNEMYLASIKSIRHDTKTRLDEINTKIAETSDTLKEQELIGAALNEQSNEYIEKLATGDIEAAEVIENNRIEQVKDNSTKKQGNIYKIDALTKAALLLTDESKILAEMEKTSLRSLLLSKYSAEKSVFENTLASVAGCISRMDDMSYELFGDNYAKWEHLETLNKLVSSCRNSAIQKQLKNRQQVYERNPTKWGYLHKGT